MNCVKTEPTSIPRWIIIPFIPAVGRIAALTKHSGRLLPRLHVTRPARSHPLGTSSLGISFVYKFSFVSSHKLFQLFHFVESTLRIPPVWLEYNLHLCALSVHKHYGPHIFSAITTAWIHLSSHGGSHSLTVKSLCTFLNTVTHCDCSRCWCSGRTGRDYSSVLLFKVSISSQGKSQYAFFVIRPFTN